MSFSHLATLGTLSYNGYTFDGASSVKVDVEFVRDEADRTVIYNRHVIQVRTFISDSASTDGQLENIKARLSHQGAAFSFINRGFGDDLVVNSAGGVGLRDVKWGPKPELLHWEPVGAAGACEVIWRVTVCVPTCGNGLSDRTSGVMAYNFSVDMALDVRGLSTRVIAGYIEIAQTRLAKNVPDCADNYRNLIQPDLPLGFQRDQQWSVSADKSRVNFTINDRQLPTKNPYPNQVTNIRGNHRAAWRRGPHAAFLFNSISLDIELALSASQAFAYSLFGQLVKARVDFAARNGMVAFIDEVVADEDIFGLSSSFGCSYRLLTNLGDLLGKSQNDSANTNQSIPTNTFDLARTGMWQAVGTDWRYWKSSMRVVQSNRGLAGLIIPAQNDVIVDLCDAGTTIGVPTDNQKTQPKPSGTLSPVFQNKKPQPRQSYLTYRQRAAIRHQKYINRQKPLQSSTKPSSNGDMMSPEGMTFNATGANSSITPSPDVLQESGTGSYQVAYVGYAERVGYEIPRPNITSIGGQTPVESESTFILEQTGVVFGVPVFRAEWQMIYELPNNPSQVSGPPPLQA